MTHRFFFSLVFLSLFTVAVWAGQSDRALDISRITRARQTDLDQMLKRVRNIRVLVPYSRTLFFVDRGRERGITADAIRQFETFLNRKYRTGARPITVTLVPVSRDHLLADLIEGRGDMAAGNITVTSEREQLVAFSKPLYQGVREVLVTGPGSPKVESFESLAGQVIAVKRSSSFFDSLTAANEQLKKAGLSPIKILLVSEDLETEDLLDMVNAGLLPMTVIDEHIGRIWTPVLKHLELRHDIAFRENADIAYALRKNSPQLKAVVDEFISRYWSSAAHEKKLQEYARQLKQITYNRGTSDQKRFEQTVDLFHRYGEKYGFDALMLAAQGYQESGLDQNARSHIGAVGVMQLMPATGKDMAVGDIGVTEPNIHAGTKYMDLLMGKYFTDAKFDEQNRALFAFASYNAGPGRISQMRKLAAKEGLNPDKWFDNVELVVARKLGIEPVRYVRNIFKYYVAYRLDHDGDERRRQALETLKAP